MSGSGRIPSIASGEQGVRSSVSTQAGDANIAQGAITFGKLSDGGKVGKFAAEYRKVNMTAEKDYKVPHGLGFVPAWAMVIRTHNANTDTWVYAIEKNYDKWTASEITLALKKIIGSASGNEVWLMIGGER